MRKIRIKNIPYYMFKDEQRGKRLKGLTKFLNFFYRLSWFILIVSIALYLCAIILMPVVWVIAIIITFGTILIKYGSIPNVQPFLDTLSPIIIGSLVLCMIIFCLRLLIKWYFILSEKSALNKNPDENVHHLAVAQVVIKTEIAGALLFFIMAGIIIVALTIINQFNLDNISQTNKVTAIVFIIFLFILPIIMKIYRHKQFKKIGNDLLHIYEQR